MNTFFTFLAQSSVQPGAAAANQALVLAIVIGAFVAGGILFVAGYFWFRKLEDRSIQKGKEEAARELEADLKASRQEEDSQGG